jgi:hypothetical protein
MLTKYMILRAHLVGEILEVDLPRDPGYERLRDIVMPILGGKGCNMEHVSVLADFDPQGKRFKPLDMFVDDRGYVKGLHRNETATEHYRRANQMGRTAVPKVADPEKLNAIYGTAILFNRRVWF